MKRTGFTRAQPERQPRPPLTPVVRQCKVSDPRAHISVPLPKREYIRSRALLDACGQIPCQRCGSTAGSVGAHSNWAIHGKALSVKADDNRVAALCSYCHHDVDQGNALRERGKRLVWWAAHARTVNELRARGLWPDGVPVPDLTFPEAWA